MERQLIGKKKIDAFIKLVNKTKTLKTAVKVQEEGSFIDWN